MKIQVSGAVLTNSGQFDRVYYDLSNSHFLLSDMEKIANIIQIVLAVILVTVVLLQSQGAGLGTVLGGTGNVYRTKRGFEKALFVSTIVIGVLFFGVALVNVLIRK